MRRLPEYMIFSCTHIFEWTAAPLACEQLAAAGLFRTLACTFALDRVGLGLVAGNGWNLGVPWNHHFPFYAWRVAIVTFILVRTAVTPILTAHRLGRSESMSGGFHFINSAVSLLFSLVYIKVIESLKKMLKFYSRNLKTHQFINDHYKFRVATKRKFIQVHLSDCGL